MHDLNRMVVFTLLCGGSLLACGTGTAPDSYDVTAEQDRPLLAPYDSKICPRALTSQCTFNRQSVDPSGRYAIYAVTTTGAHVFSRDVVGELVDLQTSASVGGLYWRVDDGWEGSGQVIYPLN